MKRVLSGLAAGLLASSASLAQHAAFRNPGPVSTTGPP